MCGNPLEKGALSAAGCNLAAFSRSFLFSCDIHSTITMMGITYGNSQAGVSVPSSATEPTLVTHPCTTKPTPAPYCPYSLPSPPTPLIHQPFPDARRITPKSIQSVAAQFHTPEVSSAVKMRRYASHSVSLSFLSRAFSRFATFVLSTARYLSPFGAFVLTMRHSLL